MLTIFIATAAAALSTAALPAAQESNQGDSAPPTQQQRTRDGNAGERRICVNERASESRIMRRVCLTAREWRDLHGSGDH